MRRARNKRKTRMTQGGITTRCNRQLGQYNLAILEPSIWLGAALLDFCWIAQPFLVFTCGQQCWMGSLMGTGDIAKIQNNMAHVMHGYLVCGHVGEVHLIFSAILAADLLASELGSVPTGCEQTCGRGLAAMKSTIPQLQPYEV